MRYSFQAQVQPKVDSIYRGGGFSESNRTFQATRVGNTSPSICPFKRPYTIQWYAEAVSIGRGKRFSKKRQNR